MINTKVRENDKVAGDQRRCKVEKQGDLNLVNRTNQECVTLENVRVVKKIAKNITSVSRPLDDGGVLKGSGTIIEVRINGVTVRFKKSEEDDLYYTF